MPDPNFTRIPQSVARLGWLPWRSNVVPVFFTLAFIVVGLPLFLRMPLWCDISLYDVAARNILDGGVHYRDVFDTNLPGYVWLLAAIRSVVGWGSEALRVVDLAFVAGVVFVLDRFAARGGATRRTRLWAVAGACGFYLFTSEFVHAQRDTWMLLPAAIAVWLRVQRATGGGAGELAGGSFRASLIEGVCWAMAVWIKPHLVVVAFPVWFLTARRLANRHRRPRAALWADLLGNLTGGGLLGVLGVAAMMMTGTWPHFWVVMTEWNPAYSQKPFQEFDARAARQLFWFPPWSWFLPYTLVVAALSVLDARPWSGRERTADSSPAFWLLRNAISFSLALAVSPFRFVAMFVTNPLLTLAPAWVWPAGRSLAGYLYDPTTSERMRFARGALGAFYLFWVAQAFFLQRGFDYVHVSETLMMIALWAAHRWCFPVVVFGWYAVMAVVMAIAEPGTNLREHIDRFEHIDGPSTPYYFFVQHSIHDPNRLRHWSDCLRFDLSRRELAELRNALREMRDHEASPNWVELDEVAEYLKARNVGDYELIAWHDSTHPLYLMLNVKPGLRFMHVNTAASIDPGVSQQIVIDEVNANKRARYVIADIESMAYWADAAYGLPNARALWWQPPADPNLPLPPAPPNLKQFQDYEFPFDRNPLLPANSQSRYPHDRRPVLFRSRGGVGRYVLFQLIQPIRASFERL